MIGHFKLHGNGWLSSLYEERHYWVPAFVKDTFWTDMSVTQWSEIMNSFFDEYVNSKNLIRCQAGIKVGYDDWCGNVEGQRCDRLLKKFDKAMDAAVTSDEKFMKLWNLLDDFFFLTKKSST